MSKSNDDFKEFRPQNGYGAPMYGTSFYGPFGDMPAFPPISADTGKFDAEQTYRFDPVYGFIPAAKTEQTENAQNNTQETANPYTANPFAYAQGMPPYHYYHPYRYGSMPFMHGQFPFCPPFAAQNAYAQNFTAENLTSSENENNEEHGLTQEKIQEIYSAVNDAINGNPNPGKLLGILQSTKGDFWKGLAVGAGAVLLFNCTPLKSMLAGLFASQFGTKEENEQDNGGADISGEQACMHENNHENNAEE